MASHRYWRVYVTAIDSPGAASYYGGNPAVVIGEIELRATIGGSDQTDPSDSYSASSTFNGSPDYAFDDAGGGYWNAGDGAVLPQWIQFDAGVGNAIDVAELFIVADPYDELLAPTDLSLRYSDNGVDFTIAKAWTGETILAGGIALEVVAPPLIAVGKINSNWANPAGKLIKFPWGYPSSVFKKISWKNATTRRIFSTSWAIKTPTRKTIKSTFDLTTSALNKVSASWENINVDRAVRQIKSGWSQRTEPGALLLPLDHTLQLINGERIEFKTALLQLDESSWGWRISLTFSDAASWQKLRPISKPVEVLLTVRGTVFNLMCEGGGKSRSSKGTNYTIKGRSITAKLAKGNADQITKNWLSTTAKTIAQELCDASGITLDWQSVDWLISRFEISARYPIDIIKKLAKSVGSIVQTSPSGVLIVRPKYLVSPSLYNTVVPSHVISDVDDFSTLSETWEARPDYDHIEIGNEAISTAPAINLSTSQKGDGVLVKATVVPFQDLFLSNSALSNVNVQYLGVVVESVTQKIEIIEGKGRVSNPFYGLLNYTYKHVDLGALSITEAGVVTTQNALHSLIDVSYLTKYHTWKAISSEDKVQMIVEDI